MRGLVEFAPSVAGKNRSRFCLLAEQSRKKVYATLFCYVKTLALR